MSAVYKCTIIDFCRLNFHRMCILCCDIAVKMLMFSSQEAQELDDVECNTANIHIMSLITGLFIFNYFYSC